MKHFRQFFVVAMAVLLVPPAALPAGPVCSRKACSEDPAHGCFRRVDGDLLQFMRSNPAGSLACLSEQLAQGGETLRRLSEFTGIIGADVKPDNVDIVEDKGGLHVGLIDLDDGGHGSFLADFLHTLSYNHAWNPETVRIPFNRAVEAYQRGLAGQALTGVGSLKDILGDATAAAAECKPLRRKARDWAEPDGVGSRVKRQYKTDSKALEDAIHRQELGQIVARGVRLKESGGSMCLPRFLYLIENEGKGKKGDKCSVVEFKAQGIPAAAVFGAASDHAARIDKLLEHYRPNRNPGTLLEVVHAPSGTYYLERVSAEARFDGASKPKKAADIARQQAFTLHMLHWLGSAHRRQSRPYAETFEREFQRDSPALRKRFQDLIEAHVVDMGRLSRLGTPGCF